MLRLFLTGLVLSVSVWQASPAYALARVLSTPSIAIPSMGFGGARDPVASALQEALTARKSDFADGYCINARSVLHFSGGAKAVNALLSDLARVEGATVQFRFSRRMGGMDFHEAQRREGPPPFDFTVDHNAWSDAHLISVTVHLGDGRIDAADVDIPPLRGRAPEKNAERQRRTELSAEAGSSAFKYLFRKDVGESIIRNEPRSRGE